MSDAKQEAVLARVARGKRPVYLDERAVDNLYAIVITMMQENAVLRDRLDTVELLLERHQLLPQGEIEQFVPDASQAARREQRQAAYLDKVLRCLQEERQQFDPSVRGDS